jgi:hypothetical protein
MSAEESVLLMNFLDTIVSLQFPLYKPDILDGGRGWLLSLCMCNLESFSFHITRFMEMESPVGVISYLFQKALRVPRNPL